MEWRIEPEAQKESRSELRISEEPADQQQDQLQVHQVQEIENRED